jgi:hypothetical protein
MQFRMSPELQPTFLLNESTAIQLINDVCSATDEEALFKSKLVAEFLKNKSIDETYGGDINIGRLISRFFDLVHAHLMYKSEGPLLPRSTSSTLTMKFDALCDAVSQIPSGNVTLATFVESYNNTLPSQIVTHDALTEELKDRKRWTINLTEITTDQN